MENSNLLPLPFVGWTGSKM